ncbi:MAG: hypothetical protein AAF327_09860 [Cyanobacteria bacterium P01_A01_bin.37]
MTHHTPDMGFSDSFSGHLSGNHEQLNQGDLEFFCAYSFALTSACESLSRHLSQDRNTLYKKFLLLGMHFVQGSKPSALIAYLNTLPDPNEMFQPEGEEHG